MNNFITPEVVGRVLLISQPTLYYWRKRGVGPAWMRCGRAVFYDAQEFAKYLERVGPIPKMDSSDKRRFFAKIHGSKCRYRAPVTGLSREALIGRLNRAERKLAKIDQASQPE